MGSSSDSAKWLIAKGRRPGVCLLAVLATLAGGGVLAGCGGGQSNGAQSKDPFAYSVELEGEIGPTRKRELERALEDAEKKRARLVILRLDTPGGRIDSMRAMVRAMRAAPLPVVVYVAPEGASADSAGVFLTVAGDVAAMAPQTNIGSASPILSGPHGPVDAPPVLYRKLLNDLTAYVRTLAEGHRRNADLAARMVRRATNVTARKARRERLVDLVAGSEAALVKRLDGFRVKGRKAQVLHTAGLRVVRFEASASGAEDRDSPDGTLALGLGLPGLISLAMLAAVIVFLVGRMLGLGRPT